MMKILHILIFFLISNFSFSEECKIPTDLKDVDLRSELGPIRDQDSVGWCDAFTAADLLGQFYSKIKNNLVLTSKIPEADLKDRSKNLVSAAGIGLSNASMNFPDFFEKRTDGKTLPEGGSISLALASSISGVCLEKNFPSDSFSFVLKKFCREKDICSLRLKDVLQMITDRSSSNGDPTITCEMEEILKNVFPNTQSNNIKQLMSFINEKKILYDLEENSCHIAFVENKELIPEIEDRNFVSPEDFNSIDNALDEGKIVGIEYNSDFLKVPDSTAGRIAANHASSLVGRRFNKKTCEWEYILRNSWGASCETYKEMGFWGKAPDTVTDYRSKARKKIKELEKKLAITDSSDVEEITKIKREKRKLLAYISFYSSKMSPVLAYELYIAIEKITRMRNPRLSCDTETGYLFVPKSELEKNISNYHYLSNSEKK